MTISIIWVGGLACVLVLRCYRFELDRAAVGPGSRNGGVLRGVFGLSFPFKILDAGNRTKGDLELRPACDQRREALVESFSAHTLIHEHRIDMKTSR